MSLYEITDNDFRPIPESSFSELKIRERDDLQRMLRRQIDVLGEDLYVLTEEFSDWEESRRRIDLLAIDPEANLVVIELKRTADGGHMELQALRYAAMVSAMTFERAAQIHGKFLESIGEPDADPRDRILGFLGWDEPQEDSFAQDVRIILASEDFGKELTTTVFWLRERFIDIKCIRLRPYFDSGRKLVDVEQIIPIIEASEYQVQVREKEQAGRKTKADRYDQRVAFWKGLLQICQERNTRHAHARPGTRHWISSSIGTSGLDLMYSLGQHDAAVIFYIDKGEKTQNKQFFDRLLDDRNEIEGSFGGPLTWERLDDRRASCVKHSIESGGYKSPQDEWLKIQKEMVNAMVRLEAALRPVLASIGVGIREAR